MSVFIRALLNNQEARLSKLTGLIGRRAGKWHGDVKEPKRERLIDDQPDVLTITPESLEAMLLQLARPRAASSRTCAPSSSTKYTPSRATIAARIWYRSSSASRASRRPTSSASASQQPSGIPMSSCAGWVAVPRLPNNSSVPIEEELRRPLPLMDLRRRGRQPRCRGNPRTGARRARFMRQHLYNVLEWRGRERRRDPPSHRPARSPPPNVGGRLAPRRL